MGSKKIECQLEDFLLFKNGKSSPDRCASAKIPVYGSNGIIGFADTYNSTENTIVIGRVGSYCGSVHLSKNKCWVSDNAIICISKNEKESLYWYYYLKQNNLNQFRSGSGQPLLNQSTLNSIICKVPELQEIRVKAGFILEKFDELISTNQNINQTLEEMAQAIFKSWFVDFDPVKAKAQIIDQGGSEQDANLAAMEVISGKTRDQLAALEKTHPEHYTQLHTTVTLFPSAFEESELGEIPEGWGVVPLEHVYSCYDKLRVPLSKPQREKKKGVIPYYGATSVMDYVDEAIFDGIYLLMGEDGSVLREDGTPFLQYIWGKSWVNNHAHVLQGTNGVCTEHLLIFLKQQNITPYVTGAVQLKLNQKNMGSIPFLKPSAGLCELFAKTIDPYFEVYRSNAEQIKYLIEARDLLLPKLLSGEIDVSQLNLDN